MAARNNNLRLPSGQRGAVAVAAAIAMVASLVAVGFAIDLGRIYFAQRDLQRVANIAAMDAARVVGGCLGPVENPDALALVETNASVLRNRGLAAWVASGQVDVGSMQSSGGLRIFDPTDDLERRAVEVRLQRTAPARLIPIFNPSSDVTLRAAAAAHSAPSAALQVGSRLVSANLADVPVLNNLFSELFDAPVTLDLATYNALLNTQIAVQPLLDELSIGEPGTDLTTTPVTGQSLLNAALDQLLGAAAAGVAQLAAAAGADTVLPSNILGIERPVEGATILLADLVMGIAQASGGDALLNLSILPPLTDLTARVISPARPQTLEPGGTAADPENFTESAQVVLQSAAPLALNVAGLSVNLQIPFYFQGAQATAEVENINCARHGVPLSTVDVGARSSIARLGIGEFSPSISAPNPDVQPASVMATVAMNLPILGQRNIAQVELIISADVNVGSEENTQFPEMEVGETRSLGTPSTAAVTQALLQIPGDLSVSVGTVNVLDLGLSPLVALVVNPVLNPILSTLTNTLANNLAPVLGTALSPVTTVLDGLLTPTLDALGVTAGGADIKVIAIKADQPYLFTH